MVPVLVVYRYLANPYLASSHSNRQIALLLVSVKLRKRSYCLLKTIAKDFYYISESNYTQNTTLYPLSGTISQSLLRCLPPLSVIFLHRSSMFGICYTNMYESRFPVFKVILSSFCFSFCIFKDFKSYLIA